ncbi:MAG: hypothetical protein IPM55_23920 [Acidobacteria bacterium]|nr:hypothetical protein [Acidobacteriota bacterium]
MSRLQPLRRSASVAEFGQDFAHLDAGGMVAVLEYRPGMSGGYLYSPQTLRDREDAGIIVPANAASRYLG